MNGEDIAAWSEEERANRDIVMEAVKRHGKALEFAAKNLANRNRSNFCVLRF